MYPEFAGFVLLEQIESDTVERGEVLCGMASAFATYVFAKSHIQHLVEFAFERRWARQAAEKGLHLTEMPEKRTAGAEARTDSKELTARLKSCPDTSAGSSGVFPQPVEPGTLN